jgi:tRNA pseudouridine55 synthase
MTPDPRPVGRTAPGAGAIDGILLVEKPTGITSAAAVAVVKRALGGAKVGHLGTLDPFASGLLPMCIGEGTKIAPYLNVADKGYTGVLRLGVSTDTLDCTGEILFTAEPPDVASVDLSALARDFTGAIEQVPPAFSAIKRGGVRMYELARRGQPQTLEARAVVVHELTLERIDDRRLRLDVRCSKGTYVRSLARDLGERLGCGAMLESLVRTRFGPFTADQALTIEQVRERGLAIVESVISPADAIAHLRTLRVDSAGAARLRAGQQSALAALERPASGQKARVLEPDGRLVAVVGEEASAWRLERVFRPKLPCAP